MQGSQWWRETDREVEIDTACGRGRVRRERRERRERSKGTARWPRLMLGDSRHGERVRERERRDHVDWHRGAQPEWSKFKGQE